MNELPLSKFAPFNKTESLFQLEVSNKLKEINVKCSNCIYFNNKIDEETSNEYYQCNILPKEDDLVWPDSFCRFFTNKEEIKDTEEILDKDNKPNQEMSIELQKLDFSNSSIKDTIKKLRENFINE